MNLNAIRFENTVSTYLKALKARTGITPNVLCRIGFCLSVEDPAQLDPEVFPADSDRVIDRHVLLGAYDPLYVAMMKQRLFEEGGNPDDDDLVGLLLRAHVHRGVHLLFKRVKDYGALASLLPREASA